ncbi:hypothetical protein, partial [Escherichia coli]|uniref:hypothetical protein n=1 Tax=Escherichia coli TaxID=562 RepID=UPI0015BCCD4F
MVQRDNPGRGIRARRRIDIGEPGHVVNFHWTPVPGATAAEVTEAMLSIGPDFAEEVTASAPFRADKNGWVIDVPAGKR